MGEILTVKEAADFAGVTRQAIYMAIWDKKISPIRMLNKLGVSKDEVKKFKRARQKKNTNGTK